MERKEKHSDKTREGERIAREKGRKTDSEREHLHAYTHNSQFVAPKSKIGL